MDHSHVRNHKILILSSEKSKRREMLISHSNCIWWQYIFNDKVDRYSFWCWDFDIRTKKLKISFELTVFTCCSWLKRFYHITVFFHVVYGLKLNLKIVLNIWKKNRFVWNRIFFQCDIFYILSDSDHIRHTYLTCKMSVKYVKIWHSVPCEQHEKS